MDYNKEELAQALYTAYKGGMENQNIIMPEWEELSPQERVAWEAVGNAISKG